MQPFSCGNSMPVIRPYARQNAGRGHASAPGIVGLREAGIHLVIGVNLVQAACRNAPGAL